MSLTPSLCAHAVSATRCIWLTLWGHYICVALISIDEDCVVFAGVLPEIGMGWMMYSILGAHLAGCRL